MPEDTVDPLSVTEKYFCHDPQRTQQQLNPSQQPPPFSGCMLAMESTCRESDLRKWRTRNDVSECACVTLSSI